MTNQLAVSQFADCSTHGLGSSPRVNFKNCMYVIYR